MNTAKPIVTESEAGQLIKDACGIRAEQITALKGGNLSLVFSFQAEGRQYVIRFNEMEDAFHTEAYIANLLSSQGIPFPSVYAQGLHKTYSYCISERISGRTLSELGAGERIMLLPELLRVITAMNGVRLSEHSSGYGFINAEGNGSHQSWEAFIRAFYAKEQPGYWENWQELFHTSCLEREVFEECYSRLLGFSKYNAPHRYFVHNDCHEWNILTAAGGITGIIDSNGIYGDFMIDIASMHAVIPGVDMAEAFRGYYEAQGQPIADFAERLTGAHYFKGLDAMRFYAKVGWEHAYTETRGRLLSMPC